MILKKKNYFFVNNFKRGFNSLELISKDYLENFQPSIVILNFGIVDCAPRLYKNNSIVIKCINKLPFVSKYFWKLSKRFKKRKIANSDVQIELFRKNIIDYLSRCKEIELELCIIIKIQKPGTNFVKKSPDIVKAVKLYNQVFDDMSTQFNFLKVINPLDSASNTDYLEDGYHLNENGFLIVNEELKNVLDSLN